MSSPKDEYRKRNAPAKPQEPKWVDPNAHLVSMQKGEVDHRGEKLPTAPAAQEESNPANAAPEVETPKAEAPVAESPKAEVTPEPAKEEIAEELPKATEETPEWKDPNAHLASMNQPIAEQPAPTEPEATAPTDEKKN